MVKLTKSLTFKLSLTLFITLLVVMIFYSAYSVNKVHHMVEAAIEAQGFALARAGAAALEQVMENDIRNGVITEEALFDRNYTLLQDAAEAKDRKYRSAFDAYTDSHWPTIIKGIANSDKNVLFAVPAAKADDPAKTGYIPTHNNPDRAKRIFNDPVGAKAAATQTPLKQDYLRDTGEKVWDISYPITVNGKHWGAFRVGLSLAEIDKAVTAAIIRTVIEMLLMLIGITAVLTGVSYYQINRPLKRIMVATANLASGQGDLTQRLPEDSEDELGRVSRFINRFLAQIHAMVSSMADAINRVTAASHKLVQGSNEAALATQQVGAAINDVAKGNTAQIRHIQETADIIRELTQAIGQIAAGASDQANNVTKTALTMEQMAGLIQEVANGTQILSRSAEETSNAAQKGAKAVEEAIAGMEKLRQTVFQSAGSIKQLGERSQQIGEIIQVIDDIAEQTNLLALNAAIEAARAGEHGKGFAVVADEVRKLAERSSKATKEIADLISNIQKETDNAVEAMNQGTAEAEEGSRLAADAGQALSEILHSVGETTEQIQKIFALAQDISERSENVVQAVNAVAAITEENSAATQEMSAGSDQVMTAIENVSAIAEESAASAEEVSVSTEQMSATVEEMATLSKELEELAGRLAEMTSKFKI
ncbi:methyl-accepting chemotaxis protein [Thermincola potens]|uniref:Methyl-accepting chemotaxis sensory transducer n=1 Tax=Thermincola potens (strain JR) TaxID=635013 RepID=D5X909_THEPJ|nr:HAMP domain-containing methyl-accepting chemotaxis protein [Thermincola potens]ADG81009.1 methyl-accepting chemotaxis sensory transducer [Thermincola potens JR]